MARTVNLLDFLPHRRGEDDSPVFVHAFRELSWANTGGVVLIPPPPGDEPAWRIESQLQLDVWNADTVVQGVGNPTIKWTGDQPGHQTLQFLVGRWSFQLRNLTVDVNNGRSKGISVAHKDDDEAAGAGRVQLRNVHVRNVRQHEGQVAAVGIVCNADMELLEVLDCSVDGVTSEADYFEQGADGQPVAREGRGKPGGAGLLIGGKREGFWRRAVVRGGRYANVYFDGPLPRKLRDFDGVRALQWERGLTASSLDVIDVTFEDCELRSLKSEAAQTTVRGCAFRRTARPGLIEIDGQHGQLAAIGNSFEHVGHSASQVVGLGIRPHTERSELVAVGNVIDLKDLPAPTTTAFVAQFLRHAPPGVVAKPVAANHLVIKGNVVRGACRFFANISSPGGGEFALSGNCIAGAEEFIHLKPTEDEPGALQPPGGVARYVGAVTNNQCFPPARVGVGSNEPDEVEFEPAAWEGNEGLPLA